MFQIYNSNIEMKYFNFIKIVLKSRLSAYHNDICDSKNFSY